MSSSTHFTTSHAAAILTDFFAEHFSRHELQEFAFRLDESLAQIVTRSAPVAEASSEFVLAVQRRGLIDDEFFERLLAARPNLEPRIRLLRTQFQPNFATEGGQHFELVLKGSVNDLSTEKVRELVQTLRQLSGDPSLVVVSIKSGSLKLTLRMKPEAEEALLKLYEAGALTNILGYEIIEMTQDADGFEVKVRDAHVQSIRIPKFNPVRSFRVEVTEFLVSAFNKPEFLEWVREAMGVSFCRPYDGRDLSVQDLTSEVVAAFERHGCIDEQLFNRLRAARPHRREEIDHIQEIWQLTRNAVRASVS